MANFNGPFEEIDWIVEPFYHGGNCPTIWSVKNEGIIHGPGWTGGTNVGGTYSASCGTAKYILHHIDTDLYVAHSTNKSSVPSSWGNQQGISKRQPRWGTGIPTYNTYQNSLCEYYEYYNAVQNPDGTWNYSRNLWRTVQYYIQVTDFDNVCPPGTVFNPYTGTCDVLDDYVWDPETGGYIYDKCIVIEKVEEYIHSDGNETYVYGGRTWTYRASIYDENNPDAVVDKDTIVNIYYPGSTIKRGVDFDGPITVTIKAGNSSVDFEIKIYENKDYNNEVLRIDGSNDKYHSCSQLENLVLNDNYDISPSSYSTCCDWVPKNFISWSLGDGMKKLIPPNKR